MSKNSRDDQSTNKTTPQVSKCKVSPSPSVKSKVVPRQSSKIQESSGSKIRSSSSSTILQRNASSSSAIEMFGSLCSMSPASVATEDSILSVESSEALTTDDNMVRLNVYGLTSVNNYIKYTGLSIYHSGVQVYGHEWAYGGYPKPVPSIYRMKKPRDLESLSDINGRFHFVQSIEMGRTKYSFDEVKTILHNLGKNGWIGTNYHLLNRNCNNFSNDLCKILVNKHIPSWVNRVATILSKFPFLIRLLPEEYLTPVALQKKLKKDEQQNKQKPSPAQTKQESVTRVNNIKKNSDVSRSQVSRSTATVRSSASSIDQKDYMSEVDEPVVEVTKQENTLDNVDENDSDTVEEADDSNTSAESDDNQAKESEPNEKEEENDE